jgi:hypothetical protein
MENTIRSRGDICIKPYEILVESGRYHKKWGRLALNYSTQWTVPREARQGWGIPLGKERVGSTMETKVAPVTLGD